MDCAALTLLAAELVCRDATGTTWSWAPLWEGLASTPRNLQGWLYPALTRGLAWWRRSVHRTSASRRFLMTVALEGGLPRSMLVGGRNGGSVGRFLGRLLREHEEYPAAELADLAQRLAVELPVVLRRPETFELAARLVVGLVELRRHVRGRPEPLRVLEGELPGWRDRLPVRFGTERDETLDHFLSGLLEQPSAEKRTGAEPTLGMWLTLREGGPPSVRRAPRFPATLPSEDLWPEGEPALLHLYLRSERGREKRIGEAVRVRDRGRYRLDIDGNAAVPEVELAGEWRLVVVCPGRAPRVLPLRGGQSIDDVPWAFDPSDEEGRCRLAGFGAVRTGAESLIVALPDRSCRGPGEWRPMGRLAALDRDILCLESDSTVTIDEDSYPIRLRSLERPEHQLSGALHLLAVTRGLAWRGRPTLRARNDSDAPFLPVVEDEVEWRDAVPGSRWRPYVGVQGDGVLRRRVGSETLHRQLLCILPPDLDVRVARSEPGWGMLSVSASELSAVYIRGHKGQVQGLDGRFRVEVERQQNDVLASAPIRLRLEFAGRGSADVEVPPPFKLAGFVDGHDRPACTGRIITLDDLHRWRAIEVGGGPSSRPEAVLTFRSDPHQELASRILEEELPGRRVLRLDAFLDVARETLCLDPALQDIDRALRLELLINGQPQGMLEIRAYTMDVVRKRDSDGTLRVAPLAVDGRCAPDASRLRAEARPVWRPTGEAVELLADESGFRVPEERMHSGWWIVKMSSEDSSVRIRPFAIEILPREEVVDAAADMHPTGRLEEVAFAPLGLLEDDMDRVLDQVVTSAEPAELESLQGMVRSFGVLPPPTLRVNQRLARNADALVEIALTMTDDEDLDAVWRGLEELPFLWCLVPVDAWERGLRRFLRGLDGDLLRDEGQRVLERLTRRAGVRMQALSVVAAELGERVLGVPPEGQELTVARLGRDAVFLDLLDQQRVALRCAHADEAERGSNRWPQANLYDIAKEIGQHSLYRALHIPRDAGWTDAVLNAPTLAAAATAAGERLHESVVRVTKRLRAFDREWFEEAFRIQLTRALGRVHGRRRSRGDVTA